MKHSPFVKLHNVFPLRIASLYLNADPAFLLSGSYAHLTVLLALVQSR